MFVAEKIDIWRSAQIVLESGNRLIAAPKLGSSQVYDSEDGLSALSRQPFRRNIIRDLTSEFCRPSDWGMALKQCVFLD